MQEAMAMERKVDLGCGSSKPEGFIGIDRMAMPGVDLIGDLDGTLPLNTNSVDLLYASHSLEHARDIMHTMREIYRVCKHGAQVCIVAPYHEQKLNVANPYHLNVFNEHTPRFWTNSSFANVELEEYWHPHAEKWGLMESDNSDPGIDFRLARMEFFYFPQYLAMTLEERIEARRKYFDVCDQIMYHLVCWKPHEAASEEDVQALIASMKHFEPSYITARRQHDRALQKSILDAHGGRVARQVVRSDLDKLEEQIQEMSVQFSRFKDEVSEQRVTEIKELNVRLQAERTRVAQYRSEIQDLRDSVDRYRYRASSADALAIAYGEMLEKAWVDGIANAHELSLFRRRRIIRLLDRLVGSSLRADLHAGYASLLAGYSKSARVRYGPDLRRSAFVPYKIAAPDSQPVAIEVALVQAVDNLGEIVGVEVVDNHNQIVWNAVEKIDGKCGNPVRFPVDFQAGQPDGEFEVRFFTPSRIGPVYPLEVLEGRFSRRRRVLGRWCY